MTSACAALACGAAIPSIGIDRLGYVEGTITAFGSIWVNGIRFDTDSAEIVVDGAAADESALRVGQVVRIEGTIGGDGSSGIATRVIFDDDLQGEIEAIDVMSGEITVLGQRVLTGSATSFDDEISPASLLGLRVGDFIEVSGFFDANGALLATRIELEDDDEVELRGFVMALDPGNERFFIGALEIDYSTASLDDFGSAGIQNEDFVEVKADSYTPGTVFVADEVELEDRVRRSEGEDVSIEGFITRFVSPTDFDVNGQPVTTNAQTDFEEGSPAELGLNVKVDVDGTIDASGTLVADDVDIEREAEDEIEARVDSVDVAGQRLVVLGIPVRVDDSTRLEDQSDEGVRPFSLSDLRAGDFVELRGFAEAGTFRATVLEREDDDEDTVVLEGPIGSIDDPEFEIFGVTIEVDGSTEFEGDDWSDADGFFALARVGDRVEVEGAEIGTSTVLADEVDQEDDDD